MWTELQVSIPLGTINTDSVCKGRLGKQVSIPLGTINTAVYPSFKWDIVEFQFH